MDSRRVLRWLKDPARKEAGLAFTEGDERQAASLVEEAERSLKAEVKRLKRELHQWQQRVSPVTEPCSCPEFCSYHARSSFEDLRQEKKALLEALRNMTGLFGEDSTRLAMGKTFTTLHTEAVKTAKATLKKMT